MATPTLTKKRDRRTRLQIAQDNATEAINKFVSLRETLIESNDVINSVVENNKVEIDSLAARNLELAEIAARNEKVAANIDKLFS